jgi:hypothetical protein
MKPHLAVQHELLDRKGWHKFGSVIIVDIYFSMKPHFAVQHELLDRKGLHK